MTFSLKQSVRRRSPLCRVLILVLSLATLHAEERRSIFDGKTLDGWVSNPGVWRVKDGSITAGSYTKKFPVNEFVCTEKSYSNFELTLKIRCSGDADTGLINSGIQIRSARVAGGGVAGYQVDCGAGWFGKIFDEKRRRLLYGTPLNAQKHAEVIDPLGWNNYRILAEGPRIQVWINDMKVTDYTEANTDIPLNGIIAVQIHKGGHVIVQVKDIFIKELPNSEGSPTWQSLGGTEAALAKVKRSKKKRHEAPALKTTSPAGPAAKIPVTKGLVLDLNADRGVEVEEGNRVHTWRNQVEGAVADIFVKQDKGRKIAGSGRPTLSQKIAALGGHRTLVFEEQELINHDEDAFDHLLTGSGYTWFSVMSVDKQHVGKKDVNSFFGNLRNGPPFEGFWGNLMDDNRVWMGSRTATPDKKGKFSLWDEKTNPCVVTASPIEEGRYYLIMGRMGAGKGEVDLELFINATTPVAKKSVPVNPKANASKMAIGQERDATNHPGKESFHGQIARFLIFERPLSHAELEGIAKYLRDSYQLKN